MLEHGADINAQTRGDEDTALHLVVEKGDFPRDFSLVLMLLENNVDLSVRNRVREVFVSIFFFFYSLSVLVLLGFLTWENGSCTRGKPAATESRYLIYNAFWNFYCFPNPPNS